MSVQDDLVYIKKKQDALKLKADQQTIQYEIIKQKSIEAFDRIRELECESVEEAKALLEANKIRIDVLLKEIEEKLND